MKFFLMLLFIPSIAFCELLDREELLDFTFTRHQECHDLMHICTFAKPSIYFMGKYCAYLEMHNYLKTGEFDVIPPVFPIDGMDYYPKD